MLCVRCASACAVFLGVLTNTWAHAQAGKSLNSAIDESAFRHAARSVKPEQYAKVGEVLVETLKGMAKKWTPEIEKAWVLVYNKVAAAMARPAVEFDKMVRPCVVCRVRVRVRACGAVCRTHLTAALSVVQQWKEVVEYQDLLKAELGKSDEDYKNRLTEIRNEIMATGTYQQTYEEISYGAKVLLTAPLQGLSIRPGPVARGPTPMSCCGAGGVAQLVQVHRADQLEEHDRARHATPQLARAALCEHPRASGDCHQRWQGAHTQMSSA